MVHPENSNGENRHLSSYFMLRGKALFLFINTQIGEYYLFQSTAA